MDYEEKELEADINYRRAKALHELVDTLEQTEKDRAEFAEKQASKAKGRAELSRILGGL